MPKSVFQNEEQKKQAIIADLTSLKEHLGWKVLLMALATEVKRAEAKLHGDDPLQEGETFEFWQQVRKDRQDMMNLPDMLIGKNNNNSKDKNPEMPWPKNMDPYD